MPRATVRPQRRSRAAPDCYEPRDGAEKESVAPDRPREAVAASVRERTRRRARFGPGWISSSPGMYVSTPIPAVLLAREVGRIERALAEHGTTDRATLSRYVGARSWGPGRYGAALREAVASGPCKTRGALLVRAYEQSATDRASGLERARPRAGSARGVTRSPVLRDVTPRSAAVILFNVATLKAVDAINPIAVPCRPRSGPSRQSRGERRGGGRVGRRAG